MTTSDKKFSKRSAAEIIRLLKDKQVRSVSNAAFCSLHGISHQTFYNWQKKYGSQPSSGNDFIALPMRPSEDMQPTPFCEVVVSGKTTIRFFHSVDARYLKSIVF